jgi:hypothetical protein
MRTEALPALEVIPERDASRRDASEDVLQRHHLRCAMEASESLSRNQGKWRRYRLG